MAQDQKYFNNIKLTLRTSLLPEKMWFYLFSKTYYTCCKCKVSGATYDGSQKQNNLFHCLLIKHTVLKLLCNEVVPLCNKCNKLTELRPSFSDE